MADQPYGNTPPEDQVDRLTYETCACGWRTAMADPDTAHTQMRLHRLVCTAVTRRG